MSTRATSEISEEFSFLDDYKSSMLFSNSSLADFGEKRSMLASDAEQLLDNENEEDAEKKRRRRKQHQKLHRKSTAALLSNKPKMRLELADSNWTSKQQHHHRVNMDSDDEVGGGRGGATKPCKCCSWLSPRCSSKVLILMLSCVWEFFIGMQFNFIATLVHFNVDMFNGHLGSVGGNNIRMIYIIFLLCFNMGNIIGCPLFSLLMSQGFRPALLVVISHGLLICGNATFLMRQSVWILLLARVFEGVGGSLTILFKADLCRTSKIHERTNLLLFNHVANFMGFICAPILSKLISTNLHFLNVYLIWLLMCVWCILGVLVVAFYPLIDWLGRDTVVNTFTPASSCVAFFRIDPHAHRTLISSRWAKTIGATGGATGNDKHLTGGRFGTGDDEGPRRINDDEYAERRGELFPSLILNAYQPGTYHYKFVLTTLMANMFVIMLGFTASESFFPLVMTHYADWDEHMCMLVFFVVAFELLLMTLVISVFTHHYNQDVYIIVFCLAVLIFTNLISVIVEISLYFAQSSSAASSVGGSTHTYTRFGNTWKQQQFASHSIETTGNATLSDYAAQSANISLASLAQQVNPWYHSEHLEIPVIRIFLIIKELVSISCCISTLICNLSLASKFMVRWRINQNQAIINILKFIGYISGVLLGSSLQPWIDCVTLLCCIVFFCLFVWKFKFFLVFAKRPNFYL